MVVTIRGTSALNSLTLCGAANYDQNGDPSPFSLSVEIDP
jgi:hypothetical protein